MSGPVSGKGDRKLELPGTVDKAVVQIEGLDYYFGNEAKRTYALRGIYLTVMPGEVIRVTGSSASGKTVLLNVIGGILPVNQGRLRVLGRELTTLQEKDLRVFRRDIGFIMNSPKLFESLTVYQNVKIVLEGTGRDNAEIHHFVLSILSRLHLTEILNRRPRQLSGGQKTRLAIARALVNQPRLVLADEPTAQLDSHTSEAVISLLKQLAKDTFASSIIVTRDTRFDAFVDRVVELSDGRITSNQAVNEGA
jgi:putative ABC transport system ATP-binding protein